MNSTMVETFQFFQQRFDTMPMALAGGCVRDHLMKRGAKDFDLFLLGISSEHFNPTRERVEKSIADLEIIHPIEWHQSEPYLCVTIRWRGRTVQILANPAESKEELVDTFDWNVCRFAYDGQLLQLENIENISEGKELKLHKVSFPLSTLRRGFRFSERFKMKMSRETVVQLSRQIVTNFDRKLHKGPAMTNEPDRKSLEAQFSV